MNAEDFVKLIKAMIVSGVSAQCKFDDIVDSALSIFMPGLLFSEVLQLLSADPEIGAQMNAYASTRPVSPQLRQSLSCFLEDCFPGGSMLVSECLDVDLYQMLEHVFGPVTTG